VDHENLGARACRALLRSRSLIQCHKLLLVTGFPFVSHV
jgi:hypothetical protein